MKKLDLTAWLGIITCLLILGYSFKETDRLAKARIQQDRLKAIEKAKAIESGEGQSTLAEATPKSTETAETINVASKEVALASDLFKLTLTNQGGGIKKAQLLEYKRKLESEGDYVTINETRPNPIGAFSSKPNEFDDSIWEIKEQTENSVTFKTISSDKLYIEKTFRVAEKNRPYEVDLDITIRNDSGAPIELENTKTKYLYAGGAAPLHFTEWSMQIGFFYRDWKHYHRENVDFFGRKTKVLGIFGKSERPYLVLPAEDEKADKMSFAGINDQFFTIILEAENPSDARVWTDRYPVVIDGDLSKSKNMNGCELAMGLPNLALNPGDQQTLSYDIFMGPKEAEILNEKTRRETADGSTPKPAAGWYKVMNYDEVPIFGWLFGWAISPLADFLSKTMVWIYGFTKDYGIAIIVLTILVRLLMWPVYAKSSRSMKRMSKLAPLMKELKDKYPDDPQKVQKETMALYGKYGINPMGGCLPMLLQLPIFLGFYRMLWGAVELRHEPFLWSKDLTMPDQLMLIPGIDIWLNLFPILMALASFVQMKMIPKTGDNTQRMIFMMMPFMFLLFCYNFASGLALYWTVSNVFTVIQTWLMNKLPEPELVEKVKKDGQPPKKPGFFSKLQDKLEEAQAQQANKNGGSSVSANKSPKKKETQNLPQPGQSRTKLASEKGSRHTKPKKRR